MIFVDDIKNIEQWNGDAAWWILLLILFAGAMSPMTEEELEQSRRLTSGELTEDEMESLRKELHEKLEKRIEESIKRNREEAIRLQPYLTEPSGLVGFSNPNYLRGEGMNSDMCQASVEDIQEMRFSRIHDMLQSHYEEVVSQLPSESDELVREKMDNISEEVNFSGIHFDE